MDNRILENFFATLSADEQSLIKDYISNPDAEVLSESFENIIKSNEDKES